MMTKFAIMKKRWFNKMNKRWIFGFVGLVLFFAVSGLGIFVMRQTNNRRNPEPEYLKNDFPYLDRTLSSDDRTRDLLSRMTVEEKIGQMTMIEKNSLDDGEDVRNYGLGAVISGMGGKPVDNTPSGWKSMVGNFETYARETRLGIPILYGVDAIHGYGNVPGATIFPHNIGLGASDDPDLVRRIAKATAEEMAATGVYWNFAPNLDVAEDPRWGRVYETFGSNQDIVSRLGKAYILGLQDFESNPKVIGAAKHYIGNGEMTWGKSTSKDYLIDKGVSDVSEKTLREVDLPPFKEAIDAGVKTIMVGLNTWNGQKVTANHYLLTDVLKKELGFNGFLVSDWYAVYEIDPSKYKSTVAAVNAGIDMVMLPYDYKTFADDMLKAIKNGDISVERINDAVSRIVKVKFDMGLFDRTSIASNDFSVIGSAGHKELAREAVRKSQVILKDDGLLPLKQNYSKIFVAGSSADDIGRQCGGWTVEWQGIQGNSIPGISILSGIKNEVSPSTQVIFDQKANFASENADLGVAVVGEKPYAEGWGDNIHPSISKDDETAIRNLQKVSKKLVIVVVSGRPIDLKGLEKNADAVVASWLPGTEGEGIADDLFGNYPFTGKLPMAWPGNF